jgi:Glycosyl transferase family 2/Methyltransferase domain
VETARRRDLYIPCPACGSRQQRYQFHRTGVRFVRCRACDLVYADPVDPEGRAYFDIASIDDQSEAVDLRNLLTDFANLVENLSAIYSQRFARAPARALLIGRWHGGFVEACKDAVALDLAVTHAPDENMLASKRLIDTVKPFRAFDIIIMNEFLEAVHNPSEVMDGFASALRADALVAVVFANMRSLRSRLIRRRWRQFFDKKITFYDADNLQALMWRAGFSRVASARLQTRYSVGYLGKRLDVNHNIQNAMAQVRVHRLSGRVSSGREVVVFQPTKPAAAECMSIIVPIYNEVKFVDSVLTRLLEKELPIDREVIIVESGSTDGSRDAVQKFANHPGVRIVYEDEAKGKGHAVRAALELVRGTIVLIQDADFEYDLDDYDALLEPILQHRSSFVLGSRRLGLEDWKVRQFGSSRIKGFMLNFAQVVFAKTFNLLYQQRVTDINTMLKVFRIECVDNVRFAGNGFNFDIELVCKIVRQGFEPLEVPVNYVARGFDEGKKISFLLDAYPSYYQLFRCRFGRF